MSSICSCPLRPDFFRSAITSSTKCVLWFLRGGIHETWVRCCVLRLKVLDRFKVGGVGHDFRELLQLLELIQFRFLFFGDSSAHNESSIGVSRKTYASNKYRQSKICKDAR